MLYSHVTYMDSNPIELFIYLWSAESESQLSYMRAKPFLLVPMYYKLDLQYTIAQCHNAGM